jgi:hypothetical protein
VLARQFDFQGPLLCEAIRATFARRRTLIPADLPVALSPEFSQDHNKQQQWQAFVRKSKLDPGNVTLNEVAITLRDFLMAPCGAITGGGSLQMAWPPTGPWQ